MIGEEMNIFIGSLAAEATNEDLQDMFSKFGTVRTVNVIKDKFTGVSRGFAFVEMDSKDEAQAAINALNGKEFKGQALTVNEARPKPKSSGDHSSRRSSGGYGGGGGGSRSGYGRGGRGGGSSSGNYGDKRGGDRDSGRPRR
jgi:RNA recognition motif-containing protein